MALVARSRRVAPRACDPAPLAVPCPCNRRAEARRFRVRSRVAVHGRRGAQPDRRCSNLRTTSVRPHRVRRRGRRESGVPAGRGWVVPWAHCREPGDHGLGRQGAARGNEAEPRRSQCVIGSVPAARTDLVIAVDGHDAGINLAVEASVPPGTRLHSRMERASSPGWFGCTTGRASPSQ